jgi:hypothetical protein
MNDDASAEQAMRLLTGLHDTDGSVVLSRAAVNDLAERAASNPWCAAMALVNICDDVLPFFSVETIRILGKGIATNAEASAFVLSRLPPDIARDCPPETLNAFGIAAAREAESAAKTLVCAAPEIWDALRADVRYAIAVWTRFATNVVSHLVRECTEGMRNSDWDAIRARLNDVAPDALRAVEAMMTDAGDSSIPGSASPSA